MEPPDPRQLAGGGDGSNGSNRATTMITTTTSASANNVEAEQQQQQQQQQQQHHQLIMMQHRMGGMSEEDEEDPGEDADPRAAQHPAHQVQQFRAQSSSRMAMLATNNAVAGRWTDDEHDLFLQGLKLYGKEWKKIAALIKTRTVVQVRTHAQKYFQKIAKHHGGSASTASANATGAVSRASRNRKRTTAFSTEEEGTNSGSDYGNEEEETGVSPAKKNKLSISTLPKLPKKRSTSPENQTSTTQPPPGEFGGITPRTVAAATILLRPRVQQRLDQGFKTPKTLETAEWLRQNESTAAQVLSGIGSTEGAEPNTAAAVAAPSSMAAPPPPSGAAVGESRRRSPRAHESSALSMSWNNASPTNWIGSVSPPPPSSGGIPGSNVSGSGGGESSN